MLVRKATIADLEQILVCYAAARTYMRANGNMSQWTGGYPPEELLRDDIKKEQLFVCEEEGKVHGVFAFILGDDPTYSYIEDGAWLNHEPYGTIHRIASAGSAKGIFHAALKYCCRQATNLRADTHHDNLTMQHLFEKYGFKRTGIIYIDDGTPRIAYQRVAE